MRYFDDIVATDIASGGYRPLRITVRPKGVELPPGPGNAGNDADAPDQINKAPPARAGLFDDIVPPAGRGSALQFPADASKETDSAPSGRTVGLFDDIVRPAQQATGPVAAPTESDIPYYDPMTGIPMTAPRLAPSSPGLPVRPETRAPLNTPSSNWSDLPVRVPRADVPLAVPDPTALGEGFPAPPGPSAMDRIKAAAARGFGDAPLGFSDENRAKYPRTYRNWQPVAAPLDFAVRAPGAAIGAISSAGSQIYQAFGGTESDANRLERDLSMLGQSAMVEGGIVGRYTTGKPYAAPFRTTEGAVGNEAAAARQAFAPTAPTTLRQIPAESSGAVPIQRSGPQPPARPPDKAAAQSDRMTKARASGPFSLEDKQQAVKTGDIAVVTRNALQGRAFEEEGLGNLNATNAAIRTQVSARPYVDASRTSAGYGVRFDAMSINEKGALQLTDFKSSESAGYTRNQKKGYPLFERYGGQVVGKSGDEHYPHGFQIQPTKVTTIRPSDFKVEK